jgi:hypothetical protein
MRRALALMRLASSFALLGAGCESAAPSAPDGGGIRLADSAALAPDAARAVCESDVECTDGLACTVDRCVGGLCERAPIDGCCAHDVDCPGDGDPCTESACIDSRCVDLPAPEGCTACAPTDGDADGDGHPALGCFDGATIGDDCDDARSEVHPGAPEQCAGGRDEDCNGRIDEADTPCGAGASCSAAIPLRAGARFVGGVPAIGTDCAVPSLFFSLELEATSDVTLELQLEEDASSSLASEDDISGARFALRMRSACGPPAAAPPALLDSGCRSHEPAAAVGSSRIRETLRRVPSGIYSVEIALEDRSTPAIPVRALSVLATVEPVAELDCDDVPPLVADVTLTGTTTGAIDSLGLDCAGTAIVAPEVLHRFTLTEPRTVQLEARRADHEVGHEGLRLRLHSSCDPDAALIVCDQTEPCREWATAQAPLAAGTYYVSIESAGSVLGSRETPDPFDYELLLHTEPAGRLCEAPAGWISGPGAIEGTTLGSTDRFHDPRRCGAGRGPDLLYGLVVERRARVVVDLRAEFADPILALFRGCDEPHSESASPSRIDAVLEPGVYYVLVDGGDPEDEGSFSLTTAFLSAP